MTDLMEKFSLEEWIKEGKVGTDLACREITADIYSRYGKDCEYFVETGTHLGGGIRTAMYTGEFSKYFSCELSESRQQQNLETFKDCEGVHLYVGWSVDSFKEILPQLDEKSLFFLDAHAEGGGVPTYEELDLIKEMCDRDDHTIIVDDVPIYFGDGSALEDKLKWVNPNYVIEKADAMVHGPGTLWKGYRTVAYIKE